MFVLFILFSISFLSIFSISLFLCVEVYVMFTDVFATRYFSLVLGLACS